jgi:transposase
MCDDRHRHQEWLQFLRVIDYVIPAEKQIHMIVDNYATHKHPKLQRWLKRHRRFQIHFTPTGCSWPNMVERFFRDLTQNRRRRGIFRNVEELITAIGDYTDHHNKNPNPSPLNESTTLNFREHFLVSVIRSCSRSTVSKPLFMSELKPFN